MSLALAITFPSQMGTGPVLLSQGLSILKTHTIFSFENCLVSIWRDPHVAIASQIPGVLEVSHANVCPVAVE